MAAGIRPYRPADRDALAEICVRTADSGGDATGLLSDDGIWPAIWLLPYLERHPRLAFVLESADGRQVGYVVAAPDTAGFQRWFHDEWWPRFAFPRSGGARQAAVLRIGDETGMRALPARLAGYPAHLHIDLLPEAQGGGWGRRLIETVVAALAERGVTGVHLSAGADNAGAIAFYPRVGFERVPSAEGERTFVRAIP